MRCGVLALQGDFAAHARAMAALGVGAVEVRDRGDLAAVEALILPGGESSTMMRLLDSGDLTGELRRRVAAGMPTLATCAGVVLLAERVSPSQPSLAVLDLDVERNAYGRQVHSCVASVEVDAELGPGGAVEGVFIRAPRITRTGASVRVLGRWRGDPVLVRQERVLAATFHPELTADSRVHRLFVSLWGSS